MSVAVRAALLCACALLLQQASAELRGRCPAEASACPARAMPCNTDEECGDKICCTTTCGKACIDPLFTGCENIKLSTERISRALAAENSRGGRGLLHSMRSPRCRTSDGEFEEIQCDNEIVSSCWCVDAAGFEVPGTRAPAAGLVNCTKVAPCAAHTCRMLCPLGFELDPRGCPLCKCRDPCTSVTCPGQLSCQLEEAPCLRPPCPPVPTCKRGRSLQNICPVGEPLLISETSRPFLCGTDPGKPNCPPLYRCLVESGNDYGVCCPASLELQKAGTCPVPMTNELDCGTPCAHDLECPSMQKCCDGGECGRHCILPHNVTMCTQQKMLAELLVVSEKEGRGYVPQCADDGSFVSRQCSRNGLVCWCVDSEGNKLRGSMGPSSSVKCSATPLMARSGARSLSSCARALCAGVCEYGYKSGADGCPTCECDDPCAGFPCPNGEECIRVKEAECSGDLCTGYPVCRPRISYENPCEIGTPASDEEGSLATCSAESACPAGHACTRGRHTGVSVCCPDPHDVDNSTADGDMIEVNYESCGTEAEAVCGLNSTVSCLDGECDSDMLCCSTANCGPVCVDPAKMRLQTDRVDDTPTMCEYLRDFDEKMEGTVDGMKLALPAPTCNSDGAFTSQQCANGRCWCVDSFGTEIPETSTNNASSVDCDKVRSELSCLELTCRMGCDYGFELGASRCPTCRCRDPCAGVTCPAGRACAAVDVACDADYCPPVPACLPRKPGQCPYLVPSNGACEWSCRTDAECGAAERCCATGCGTACTPAVHQTHCQQRRALALHTAAENGSPPAWAWIPKCKEDGSYETVQCRGSDKACWCVDIAGNEIQGTRATNSTPNCNQPITCPANDCSAEQVCAYGWQLDAKGCPTCDCLDPCADAKCRSDEICELVSLECEGESCLPLARCAPSPQCPEGLDPIQAPDGSGPLKCGPNAAACPSTHACRFAPHDSRPSVCCPKPRTVCFENKDEGNCSEGDVLNTTRWHFNHERNRCERFKYHGCSGNHNNFRTKEECNNVCPVEGAPVKQKNKKRKTSRTSKDEVLSPCERLREKNEAASEKYGKGTFIPKCDATGAWEPVQCMSHIDVCWCVSARGEPLKGSLVRGAKPSCNFRQARKWVQRDPMDERSRADEVLEELIRQMTAYRGEDFDDEDDEDEDIDLEAEGREEESLEKMLIQKDEPVLVSEIVEPKPADSTRRVEKPLEVSTEKISFKTKCQMIQEEIDNGGEGLRPRCLSDGSFSPRQCNRGRCWCVDAAGQKRQHIGSVNDAPAPDTCEPTRVESAVLELELLNVEGSAAEAARGVLAARLAALGARVPVTLAHEPRAARLRALLAGPRAVDYVYHIENLVKQEKLSGTSKSPEAAVLGADVIRSEYRLAPLLPPAMQQREILSESTVSATTSYHTALIVLAATSAFIISVLCVLVMLYRARLQREPQKAERFLPAAPPVYVLSADEKAELARVLHSPPPPIPPQNDDQTRV
ncbi:neurogenic locus notch homolog protein 1-like isoform X1 [Trichoplusia ni]|uniref:Neurogenic locus notch homolog protein 1-like isoform X1 n=1 Tax=Trichoplusia ni TaxID=7111 RepID=A0A7E5W177_TRINI|nr:neurogenic locus notch homolog protein 1-like isoform X1 [Trichoplusia ni]